MIRFGAGTLFGLIAYAVSVAETLLRLLLNPFLWERATAASALWMLAFGLFFLAGGVTADALSRLQAKWLRFMLIGAVFGALVWSYLHATWPLTSRAGSFQPPQSSLPEAAATGAVLGAAGGLLMRVVLAVSGRWRRRN
jgi:hypothetical protein